MEKKEAQLSHCRVEKTFFLLPKLVLWPNNISPWLAVGPAGSQHSLVHRVLTLQCITSSFPPQSEAAADRTQDINQQCSSQAAASTAVTFRCSRRPLPPSFHGPTTQSEESLGQDGK